MRSKVIERVLRLVNDDLDGFKFMNFIHNGIEENEIMILLTQMEDDKPSSIDMSTLSKMTMGIPYLFYHMAMNGIYDKLVCVELECENEMSENIDESEFILCPNCGKCQFCHTDDPSIREEAVYVYRESYRAIKAGEFDKEFFDNLMSEVERRRNEK